MSTTARIGSERYDILPHIYVAGEGHAALVRHTRKRLFQRRWRYRLLHPGARESSSRIAFITVAWRAVRKAVVVVESLVAPGSRLPLPPCHRRRHSRVGGFLPPTDMSI